MTIEKRLAVALGLIRENTTPESRAQVEHAFALAAETMLRTGVPRAFLTGTEVERFVPQARGNGRRLVSRVVATGALREITDTDEGWAHHVAQPAGSVWKNARCFSSHPSRLTRVVLVRVSRLTRHPTTRGVRLTRGGGSRLTHR